jgi:hypothetical protein
MGFHVLEFVDREVKEIDRDEKGDVNNTIFHTVNESFNSGHYGAI